MCPSDPTTTTKRCTKCGKILPATLDHFYWNKRAAILYSWCKACHYLMNGGKPKPIQAIPLPGFRKCSTCSRVLPLDSFPNDKKSPSGKGSRCTECNRKAATRWNKKNPERAQARVDKWIEEHPERSRQQQRASKEKRKQNPVIWEKERQRARRWRQDNQTLIRSYFHVRRARQLGAPGTHNDQDIEQQYHKQNGLCFWCSKLLNGKYHVDHIIPLSRDGSNWPDNLACSCASCNYHKADKLPFTEWQPPNPLPIALVLKSAGVSIPNESK